MELFPQSQCSCWSNVVTNTERCVVAVAVALLLLLLLLLMMMMMRLLQLQQLLSLLVDLQLLLLHQQSSGFERSTADAAILQHPVSSSFR